MYLIIPGAHVEKKVVMSLCGESQREMHDKDTMAEM